MSGFGLLGFGTGPFGLGLPVSASVPPDGPAGCRYLNPSSKDYAQDSSTRQLQQMPKVRQQVLLALTTLKGSASTLREFGVRLPRKMGDRFQTEAEQSVRLALRHLTHTQKVIRIDYVLAEHGRGGRGRITVAWTNLETGKQEKPLTI